MTRAATSRGAGEDDRDIRVAELSAHSAGSIDSALQILSDTQLEQPIDAGVWEHEHRLQPQIAGYSIERELSRGGQAAVYSAVQESTGQSVAIKVVHGGPFVSSARRARFEREIKALATVRHPNVVRIFDRGRTSDGSFFLVMERIEGRPLDIYADALRADAPSDPRAILRLIAGLADAVQAVHDCGIIHRDLKPTNVLIDQQGQPRLLDFGLACPTGDEEVSPLAVTATGQLLGSLAWTSPEQTRNSSSADCRSDVYSLGMMLYQAITGEFPYPTSGALLDVVRNIQTASIQPPSRRMAWRGLETSSIDAVVLKALNKSPASRYATAKGLADDLRRCCDGRPTVARVARFGRGWMTLLGLVIAATVLATFTFTTRPRATTVVVMPLATARNSVGMTFVKIPAGSCNIGISDAEGRHDPSENLFKVVIDRPFYLSVTEVTRGQFLAVMNGAGLVEAADGDLPQSGVTWQLAMDFCRKLSARERRRCRVPTEAEWEYACRAGSAGPFSGTGDLDTMGWYAGNSGGKLHPVRRFSPNVWGLYDMHGGIAEWCDSPFRGNTDNDAAAAFRVAKGGSYLNEKSDCRAGRRSLRGIDLTHPDMGLRIVMEE